MAVGDWIPLYISLTILFIIGGFLPVIIAPFVDLTQPTENSFVNTITGFISNGIYVDLWITTVTMNPMSWFGSEFQNFLITRFNAFSYIPTVISFPLLSIVFVGLIWSAIKIIPFT